jgi:ectoine hydroxylase-related dioxygenase (phytanoyl-CoA dioxygenase family)
MNTEEAIRAIDRDGYYVLKGVIPRDKVDAIAADVIGVQAQGHQAAEEQKQATRARGHRVGARGVRSMRQVINATQSFAAFLAHPSIMAIVEDRLGPWSRISCTDCVINDPGNERGYWHADWPYNQTNASHIPAPYPDVMLHLSTIWMLSDFTKENGGTWILPGSHRSGYNPSSATVGGMDSEGALDGQIQIEGDRGSVLLYDSRLWHAVAANVSSEGRVALLVRYAPWWLNLNPTQTGSPEYEMMVAETGGKNYEVPALRQEVYKALPTAVQPLYRHWIHP